MTDQKPTTEELARWLDDLVLIDELRSPDLPKQAAARLRELAARFCEYEDCDQRAVYCADHADEIFNNGPGRDD